MNMTAASTPLAHEIATATDQSVWPKICSEEMAARIGAVWAHSPAGEFLAVVASGSPFMARLFMQQTEHLEALLAMSPDLALTALFEEAERLAITTDIEIAKKELRGLKARIAMLLAIVDLSGLWTTEQVMQALSDFADRAVKAAFCVSLNSLFPDAPIAFEKAGLAVLAMGKHGARELNYSSDIDLVVFYDPDTLSHALEGLSLPPRLKTPKQIAVQVTRSAVDILQEQRADGYVFRTDLRLRPDPGSSAVAVTVATAHHYYEAYGQNWERAAFIKARLVAGDQDVYKEIKEILTPFIWRKYLDYAAIADIHSIKRQIHASKGSRDYAFAGHDIKIGHGGIREIEFFVQTQQLILGGKNPELRMRETLRALKGLVAAEQIEEGDATKLSQAYLYLRHIEHRIQMVNDEQTHSIPKSEGDLLRLARLCGYETSALFEDELGATLRFVHDHYADLFHEEEDTSLIHELRFTGVDHDPETIKKLLEMGFQKPETVSEAIRHWYGGGIKAVRTKRARELLPGIVPSILHALGEADNPDAAFAAFNGFLRNLPAGIQFFSLVQNNPEVLDRIAGLVGVSPRHRALLAQRTYYVEALLDEAFLQGRAGDDIDADEMVSAALQADNYEEALNILRRCVKEARFQASSHLLLKDVGCRDSGGSYAKIAEATVQAALPVARREAERTQGRLSTGGQDGLAVIGMGRLGAGSLTATSDLDLIFVYDCPAEAISDGKKPLDGTTWYTRYVRRLVTTLSAQTEEGGLYEVDMALRPSGGAGPAAVSLAAFDKYYERDAWTWEEMALVKARVVAGEGALPELLTKRIEKILTRPRDQERTRADALDMRRRLLSAKPATGPRDVKLVRGGLTDIDFICQYLSLIHAADHGRFPLHIQESLASFVDKGLLGAEDASVLDHAWRDYEMTMQITRTALGQKNPVRLPKLLAERLSQRLNLPLAANIDALLGEHQKKVTKIFTRLIGAV